MSWPTGKLLSLNKYIISHLFPSLRYLVLPLVTRCGQLLASSLSPRTALRLGVLGEEYLADHLLEASARYFANNLRGCLSSMGWEEESDWMEEVQHCPRLTQGILEALKLGQESRLNVLLRDRRSRRYSEHRAGGQGDVHSAHIEFTIKWAGLEEEARPLFLVAFGLYRVLGFLGGARTVEVFKQEGMESLSGKLPVQMEGNWSRQEQVLEQPVALQPATR